MIGRAFWWTGTAVFVSAALVLGFLYWRPEATGTQLPVLNNGGHRNSASEAARGFVETPVGNVPIKRQRSRAFSLDEQTSPPEGNAVNVVRALRPLAEAGDAKAALSIYLKLGQCQDALSQTLDDETIAAYEKMGAAKSLVAQTLRQVEECDGAVDLMRERGKWLEQAADAGSLEAQLLYSTDASAVLGSPSEMLASPESVEEYKRKAAGFLQKAAARGNLEAMLSMAARYRGGGGLFKRDLVRGYAYYRAVDRAQPGIVPHDLFLALEQEMTSQDVGRANEMARSIYRECCN